MSVTIKGEPGKFVDVGVKVFDEPADGSEKCVRVPLTSEYARYDIPLTAFASYRVRIPQDLSKLYVVTEFAFSGDAQTVFVKNIRFLP